ncbi:MAG: hypothetical protein HOJ61_06945 [Gammaproteobacteria bacterium]|jgi:hypothetical protein|nr:hypothetical protein [Gammaproteobacteria bacterium]MBT5601958.1 hypothetical protein [Gammaproteobacteria bacterium]MBT6243859.1 hypothetical protein [Gammaproteobacteria bacterium]
MVEHKESGYGWVGIDKESDFLKTRKSELQMNSGIHGLDICDPDELERAAKLFYRDGFVCVKEVLTADQLSFLRSGCDRVIKEMLDLDPARTGNRGSHRYSFGGASKTGGQLHHPEWAMLVDIPIVSEIVSAIFGSADYIVRSGGGDFCLPGAIDYQPLHSDMSDRQVISGRQGKEFVFGSFSDPEGRMNYRDLPCPYICCNFLATDFTRLNGPTRQIAGTQRSQQPMPSLEQEPAWMKLSTVCPVPAGSVLIRDVRAWHGGTPNLSEEVRAIPNVEYFAPWFREPMPISMPYDVYQTLSAEGKLRCRYIVGQPGEALQTGYRKYLGGTPPGSQSRPVDMSSSELMA